MKLKYGVSIAGASQEIVTARKIVETLWKEHGQELVITGGTETPKEHKENSRHAYGDAEDYRVRYFTSEAEQIIIRDQLIIRLKYVSKNYYVQLHIGHHMHVQYKPEGEE